MTTKKPASANDVLHSLREDHNWRHDPLDLTSTGGIQRNIQALWSAVQALADYHDGIATGTTDSDGNPIKAADQAKADEQARIDSAARTSPVVSRPASTVYPATPAPAV